MTTQWSSQTINKNLELLQSGVLDETVVILLQGKNTFGDRIYSYVKLTVKDLMRLKEAMGGSSPFNPTDFGSVVAAGKGDPTDEVKAEIAALYKLLDLKTVPVNSSAPPPAPKAWDEY
jgi:hypothetical protein